MYDLDDITDLNDQLCCLILDAMAARKPILLECDGQLIGLMSPPEYKLEHPELVRITIKPKAAKPH